LLDCGNRCNNSGLMEVPQAESIMASWVNTEYAGTDRTEQSRKTATIPARRHETPGKWANNSSIDATRSVFMGMERATAVIRYAVAIDVN
jgi:hypothetical protein